MNEQTFLKEFYDQRINELGEKLKKLYEKKNLIGWLRLAALILTALAVYSAWNISIVIIIVLAVIGLSIFFFLVLRDADNREEIQNLEILEKLNKNELQYAEGNFDHSYDGKNLEPGHHAYAADLDLFGEFSLYQYVNRCNSENAKQLLAKRLLEPLTKAEILEQQEAARELSQKPLWGQQLQAYGITHEITLATEKNVAKWLGLEEKSFNHKFIKPLLYVYPIITSSCLYLSLDGYINAGFFLLLLMIFFGISGSFSKKITPTYNLLSKIVSEINVLSNELSWFEKESFQSKLLINLQEKIKNNSINASNEILRLKKILNRFDTRLNAVAFAILNTFFLWDLWQFIALKEWKKKNITIVPYWFETIAVVEVINSFAMLSFNHPAWCFPSIADEHFTLSAEEIGHPLISEKARVNNTFQMNGLGKIDLITGSNMAGKSTFLRSVGINMILAYAGGPVCAKKCTLSIATLVSSMRITDNLAENTSTFYAELKKLKSVIQSVISKEKVVIMLDEILRGTNSLDRHTGSSALIKQLIKHDAVALIATHDIALAQLGEEFPHSISNYHFDVQVAGEELFFDYKLKKGICTSLNASLLMKKIGIELG